MSNLFKTLSALSKFGNEIAANQRKYATEIGEVSIQSNKVHRIFFSYFHGLLNIPLEVSKSLWETAQMDKAQRTLLRSITGLITNLEYQDFLIRGIDDAETISAFRNTLIHTIVDTDYESLQMKPVEHANSNKHLERFKLIHEKDLYGAIKEDLYDLSNSLFLGSGIILGLRTGTLPERPPLRVYAYQTPPKSSQTHPHKDQGQEPPP